MRPRTAQRIAPETSKVSDNCRVLRKTIKNPTTSPKTCWGTLVTSQAAMGAAKTPPITSATTASHGMELAPNPRRNPILALRATTNSAVLVVPIALRGSKTLDTVREVVTTGPHPPPPVESTKPPTSPRGTSHRFRPCLGASCTFFLTNLAIITNPNTSKMPEVPGASRAEVEITQ